MLNSIRFVDQIWSANMNHVKKTTIVYYKSQFFISIVLQINSQTPHNIGICFVLYQHFIRHSLNSPSFYPALLCIYIFFHCKNGLFCKTLWKKLIFEIHFLFQSFFQTPPFFEISIYLLIDVFEYVYFSEYVLSRFFLSFFTLERQ